jgi:hypothetical protein
MTAKRARDTLARAELIHAPLAVVVRPPDWSNVARGVAPGGPFDDLAAAIATSAVRGDVELLECPLVAPQMRFRRDAVVAWCPPSLDTRVQRVRAGEELSFGRTRRAWSRAQAGATAK